MAGNKKGKELKDFLIRSKFFTPRKDSDLPAPSLEDVRDSGKNEFFSVKDADKDEP